MRANSYGTTRYNPQTKIVIASANLANEVSVANVANDVTNSANKDVPSFNTKTIEDPQLEEITPQEQSIDSQYSSDSQQDKLNMICVAMKAAGMSSAEIAQALKAELELVF